MQRGDDNNPTSDAFLIKWLEENNIDPEVFNVEQLRPTPVQLPEPLDVRIRASQLAAGGSLRRPQGREVAAPAVASSRTPQQHDAGDAHTSDESEFDDDEEDAPMQTDDEYVDGDNEFPRDGTGRSGAQRSLSPPPPPLIDERTRNTLRMIKVFSLRENIREFSSIIWQMYYRMYDNGDATAILANSDPMFRIDRLETVSESDPLHHQTDAVDVAETEIAVLEGLRMGGHITNTDDTTARLLTRKDVYMGKNNVRTEIPMLQIMRLVHRLIALSTRLQIKNLVNTTKSQETSIIDLIEACFQSSVGKISNLMVDNGEFLASHDLLVPFILVFCWFRGWCRFSKNDRQKENFLLRALDYIPATRTPFDQYFSNIITQNYPIYHVPRVHQLIDELNILAVKPAVIDSGYRGADNPYDRSLSRQWLTEDFNRADVLLRTRHWADRVNVTYRKMLLFLEMKNRELTGKSQVYAKIKN